MKVSINRQNVQHKLEVLQSQIRISTLDTFNQVFLFKLKEERHTIPFCGHQSIPNCTDCQGKEKTPQSFKLNQLSKIIQVFSINEDRIVGIFFNTTKDLILS